MVAVERSDEYEKAWSRSGGCWHLSGGGLLQWWGTRVEKLLACLIGESCQLLALVF